MIHISGFKAHLDFVLAADTNNPAVISFYDRSLSLIKSIGASLSCGVSIIQLNDYKFNSTGEYDTIITPIITGKDKFYHAISISKRINENIMICKNGDQEVSFYNLLMNQFNLPLMKEWASEMYSYCMGKQYISWNNTVQLIKGEHSISNDFSFGYDKVKLENLRIFNIRLTDVSLESCVKDLFSQSKIWITQNRQKPLTFSNMDSYFKEYGKSLVENLEKSIVPLTELNGNIDYFVMRHMRLFPQQAAQVNGVVALLDRSSYAILNEGMGTGKVRRSA